MKKILLYVFAFSTLFFIPSFTEATTQNFSCSAVIQSEVNYANCTANVGSGFQGYDMSASAKYNAPQGYFNDADYYVELVACISGSGQDEICKYYSGTDPQIDFINIESINNEPYPNYTQLIVNGQWFCQVDAGGWINCNDFTVPGGITSLGGIIKGRSVSISNINPAQNSSHNIGQTFQLQISADQALSGVTISTNSAVSCGPVTGGPVNFFADCVGVSLGTGTITVNAKGPINTGASGNVKTVTQTRTINIVGSGGGGGTPPPPPPGSYNLTINKSGAGVGTVVSTPAGISCGTTCSTNSASFTSGTSVTLTASAGSDSTFTGWSGSGCSGTGNCTVSMTAARTVTASFSSTPQACADCADYVSHVFNGVPNPTTATLTAGQSYTVSYTYKNTGTNTWSCCTNFPSYHPHAVYGTQGVKAAPVDRRPDIANLENTVNPVYANHTAPSTPTNGLETFTWNHTAPTTPGTYEFVPAVLRGFYHPSVSPNPFFSGYTPTVIVTVVPNTQYALTVTKAGNGVGTVTSVPAGISCGSDCSQNYTNGTSVTLAASASAGSTFTGWSGSGCSGTGNCTVSMTAARSVTATFTQNVPTITSITISPNPASANAVTQHTIRVVSSYSGSGLVDYQYAIINYTGSTGQRRGYITWRRSGAWSSEKDSTSCSGGGSAALLITGSYNGYGSQYLELDSCSTSLVGNLRTVNFVVRFNNANSGEAGSLTETKAFTSPTTNTISGYARVGSAPNSGWILGPTFSLAAAAPPTITSANISPTNVTANGTSQNTITVIANYGGSGGGSGITAQYAIINYQGTHAGQHRGYPRWSSTSAGVSGYKDVTTCTGGGYAGIYPSAYGPEYMELNSCSTSVNGNTRTVVFNVSFNTNFTSPTTNNRVSGYAALSGSNSGWQLGNTFSLSAPVLNYTLNAENISVEKGSGTVYEQGDVVKTLTSGTPESVTLSVSGLPSGVSVQSISNQGCSPNCTSVLTLAVSSSAPTGNHTITVTGAPGNVSDTFTLSISGNPMSVSCSASPDPAKIGELVTWTASVSGGTPPYTYSWSGSESLSGDTASVTKTYSTLGTKTATVTVTDSDSISAECDPAGVVQIYFNPRFEEF